MFALYPSWKKIILYSVISVTLAACGKPALDPSSVVGQEAIIDQTNNDLTLGDCSDALITILPLYNSVYTNNQVRMLTASAYACDAGLNFFSTLSNIGLDSGTLSATFWGFFAQLFPSTTADKVVESAGYSMDVLMTVLTPGQVILPSDMTNVGTNNPGSLNYSDRIGDANIYMLLVSMAAIGGNESRYGNPNATFHPQSSPPLPFNDNVTKMTDQGCIYAAGLLNFFDSVGPASSVLSSSVSSVLNKITAVSVSQYFDTACDYGCKGTTPSGADIVTLNPTGNWNLTGCSIAAGCGGCPKYLRDYTQCHPNVANDPGACAAAGLANFVNASLAAWQ